MDDILERNRKPLEVEELGDLLGFDKIVWMI